MVQRGHFHESGRETYVELVSQLPGRRQSEALHLPKARSHHEIRKDQIGREIVCVTLRIERVIAEVADVVFAAEQDPSAVMVPMPEFVPQRKAPTLTHAEAVNRDDGWPLPTLGQDLVPKPSHPGAGEGFALAGC